MPIYLLVADVLLAIFGFAVEEDGGISKCGYSQLDMQEDMRRRLNVSHVCRYWRESVLNSPSFWAVLDARTRLGSELFLPRAGTLPLSTTITMPVIRSVRLQVSVKGRPIRSLAISVPSDKRWDICDHLKSCNITPVDVSELRCLSISSPHGISGVGDAIQWSRGPVRFLSLPRLHTLVVIGQGWMPSSVPQLTRLHIRECIIAPSTLHPFLSRCPLLEQLVLYDILDETFASRQRGARVMLPRLRLLVLGWAALQGFSGGGGGMYDEIGEIDMPATCLVRVVRTRCVTVPHPFPDLAPLAALDTVSAVLSRARLTFCASDSCHPGRGLLYAEDRGRAFRPEAATAMLTVLFKALDAERLEHVTLTVCRGWEYGGLTFCLELLPAVRTLTIQHTLRGASCPPWPADELRAIADALADPTVCPRLETLVFSSPDASVVEKLDASRILAARAAAGYPLRRLTVFHVDNAVTEGIVHSAIDEAQASGECKIVRAVRARHPVEPLTPGIMWKEHMLEWQLTQSTSVSMFGRTST